MLKVLLFALCFGAGPVAPPAPAALGPVSLAYVDGVLTHAGLNGIQVPVPFSADAVDIGPTQKVTEWVNSAGRTVRVITDCRTLSDESCQKEHDKQVALMLLSNPMPPKPTSKPSDKKE